MFNALHPLTARRARLAGAHLILAALLGCGDGSAPTAQATLDGGAPVHEQALSAACDFSGTWAVKFDIPVAWRFNPGISSGSGTIEQWALVERRVLDDHTLEEVVRPCGSAIPTYRALAIYGGEEYGVSFPDALFDSGVLPTLTGTTWIGGHSPGNVYDTRPLPLTLGVDLPQASTAHWPKRLAELTPHVVDSDEDGQPGVTAVARQDGSLVLPPVNTTKSRRATKFHIALRNVIGARGKIISCDRFEGSAVVAEVAGKPAISSTILGCELTDSSACSRAQATLANTFQPAYQVGPDSRSVMVRVQDGATCAEVRALTF